MNINFGLFPPLRSLGKNSDGSRFTGTAKSIAKRRALTARALEDLGQWILCQRPLAAAE
jgi:methylenetetrahydrofolate--tRNA-(uracil-5-)-methyltransferase